MSPKQIAESTVRRLSLYLSYLESLPASGAPATVSSDDLANLVDTTSAQVRKDLSFFGSFGKRGLGYSVTELTNSLRDILGLSHDWRICIVGAGKIGIALAQYPGFAKKGFHVEAIYDCAPEKIGTVWNALTIRDEAKLVEDARTAPFDIGVIAVPAASAQEVAGLLVEAGVKAIMNFAPAQITVPNDIIVRTVNMALEFEGLSFALTHSGK